MHTDDSGSIKTTTTTTTIGAAAKETNGASTSSATQTPSNRCNGSAHHSRVFKLLLFRDHFDLVDRGHSRCRHCCAIITSRTHNMKRHLERIHNPAWCQILADPLFLAIPVHTPLATTPRQNKPLPKDFETCMVDMLTADAMPVATLLTSAAFRTLHNLAVFRRLHLDRVVRKAALERCARVSTFVRAAAAFHLKLDVARCRDDDGDEGRRWMAIVLMSVCEDEEEDDEEEGRCETCTLAVRKLDTEDNRGVAAMVDEVLKQFEVRSDRLLSVVVNDEDDEDDLFEALMSACDWAGEGKVQKCALRLLDQSVHAALSTVGELLDKVSELCVRARHTRQLATRRSIKLALPSWRFACWRRTHDMLVSLIAIGDDVRKSPARLRLPPEDWAELGDVERSLKRARAAHDKLARSQVTPGALLYEWKRLEFDLGKSDAALSYAIKRQLTERAEASLLPPAALLLAGVYVDPKNRNLLTEEQLASARHNFIDLALRLERIDAERRRRREGKPPSAAEVKIEPDDGGGEDEFDRMLDNVTRARLSERRRNDVSRDLVDESEAVRMEHFRKKVVEGLEVVEAMDRSQSLMEAMCIYPRIIHRACYFATSLPTTHHTRQLALEPALKLVAVNSPPPLERQTDGEEEGDSREKWDDTLDALIFVRCNSQHATPTPHED